MFSEGASETNWLISTPLTTQPIFTCLKSTWNPPRTTSEICSTLTVKTPKRHHWRPSGIVIVKCYT